MKRWSVWGSGLLLLVLLQGCATVTQPDRRDPWESFNRGVFSFNDGLDKAILKPVATAYQDVVPSLARKGVSNFFGNLRDVWSVVNNALQGRKEETGNSIGRVLVNTTVGLLGVFDVASELQIERNTTDFGTTLGRWGIAPGPYLVLPLFGPSTLREAAGLPVDNMGNLVNYAGDRDTVLGLQLTNIVQTRAGLLGAGDVVEGASLDKYAFMRDAYLQRQRNRQYDGNPPEEDDGTADTPTPSAPSE